MKRLFLLALTGAMTLGAHAQRVTDKLDRGLVAVPSGSGCFVSWRKTGEEYYDTQYNLYRDGTKIASNLSNSNFQDSQGKTSSTYQVEPVVKGVAGEKCAAVKPWANAWLDVKVQPVVNRAGKTIGNSRTDGGTTTSGYTLNDVSLADVDGDGVTEFIVKRNNSQGNILSADNKTDFNLYECYQIDGTRLWWIDLGPNLMAGPDEQWDMIGFDWDRDGKAEVLMRGADNMIIHTATGKTINVGNMNYYAPRDEYTHQGAEYLLYLNGATGEPFDWDGSESYTPMAYPLPRFEEGEAKNPLNATSAEYKDVWGDADTGHRSCKHYFGAPYLDGRNPSIFLGRGCYTRHKACALDVDPATHQLTQRWRWNCYDSGSAWFGNGFHNFAIADVDMDGRDEIVYGSMVLDDTGFGLATTGLGHGDAQHCGDLDPYRWGLEQFTCLEGSQGNSYWNAATGQIYYRKSDGGDDGRALAGNFSNDIPGGEGRSVSSGVIGLSSDKVVNTNGDAMSGNYANLNMRIYWDGDLLDEILNSAGGEGRPAAIFKWGGKRIWTSTDAVHNNSSKCNPSAQGDILGDWREEVVLRTSSNDALRIFTTTSVTEYGLYSLWHDYQYRNGMAWQCVGYNQPPHASFFLGELEGITIAPPPLMLSGRTEVSGTIASTADHLLVSGYEDRTIAVEEGAAPYILTVNTPAHYKGTGAQKAVRSTPKQPEPEIITYTTTLTGGAFAGAMRLVKQGEGVFVLPNVVENHTGETNIWNGTLVFDGTMAASPVWLNRHTTLISDGGQFLGGLKADYNATICPGGQDKVGSVAASTLNLGFGSRVVFDVKGTDIDQLSAKALGVETKDWSFGPKYKTPVFEFTGDVNTLPAGTYVIGEVEAMDGESQLSDILIEGISGKRFYLDLQDGKLCLVLEDMREAATVVWNGTADNNIWDLAETKNFLNEGESVYAAKGDDIIFDDNAANGRVNIKGAVRPNSITFNNSTLAYTLMGDSILGGGTITKNGTAKVTINTENRTGATIVNEGTLVVNALANLTGITYGALGNASQRITLNDGVTFGVSKPVITDQPFSVSGNVNIEVPSGIAFTLNKGMKGAGATVTKTGAGTLTLGSSNTFSQLVVKAGTVYAIEASGRDQLPASVEFQGGTLWAANNESSNISNNTSFIVPKGKTGTFYGGYRSTYTGALTGEGTFNCYTGGVRCYFDGDWSSFEGKLNVGKNNRQNKQSYTPVFAFRNTNGLPNATVNVQENVVLSNEGVDIEIGSLTGKGTLIGSGKWILGSNGNDFYLNTEIGLREARDGDYKSKNSGDVIAAQTSPVVKRGAGKMTMMTLGKLNGVLTVEEGTVSFNNAALSTLVNGANATTIKNGGRIVGQGLLQSLTVDDGGELVPCGSYTNETTPGVIKVGALMNAKTGSTVKFLIAKADKYSQLQPKLLTLNSTVKVELLDGFVPEAGSTFTLWEVATTTVSGKPQFDLPVLPAGLEWDTTEMVGEDGKALVKGVLKVVEGSAVGVAISGNNAPVACTVYAMDGTRVATIETTAQKAAEDVRKLPLRAGTYIINISGDNRAASRKIVVK